MGAPWRKWLVGQFQASAARAPLVVGESVPQSATQCVENSGEEKIYGIFIRLPLRHVRFGGYTTRWGNDEYERPAVLCCRWMP